MTKISITAIFEVSKLLATEAGGQLKDALTLLSDLVKQVVPALNNGLTFADNHDCAVKDVELRADTLQIVDTGSTAKLPTSVLVGRVFSTSSGVSAWQWYVNDKGQLVVKASFTGSPTGALKVRLLIFF